MTISKVDGTMTRRKCSSFNKNNLNSIPKAKFYKAGTKVLNLPEMKTVIPAENSKLSKLGVESITCYKKGYFTHSDKLMSFKMQGMKKGIGLFNTAEAKSFIKMLSKFIKSDKISNLKKAL